MTIDQLEHWLRYCGLDSASFGEDNDGQLIVYTGVKSVTHCYTDMTGEPRSYETLEPMDYSDSE